MSYFENSNLNETVDVVNTASLLVDIFKKKNKNIFTDSRHIYNTLEWSRGCVINDMVILRCYDWSSVTG